MARLAAGQVPVLAAYSLGKAQEVLIGIGQRAPELTFLLHHAVGKMTEVYQDLGYETPAWSVLAENSDLEGNVVIAPPNTLRSEPLASVKNRVTAMISGWGVDPRAKYRYRVDAIFPLTDHADYDDLVRYVRTRTAQTNPHPSRFRRRIRGRFASARMGGLVANRRESAGTILRSFALCWSEYVNV